MQTLTLAKKDLNPTSTVPHNIKATIMRIDADDWTTHLFNDDRDSTADDQTRAKSSIYKK